MKKQREATQAEKDFDAEVAKFNQEARRILDDRTLPMSTKRRLMRLKGKALLQPAAPRPQADSTH
jgi:N-acyl-D-aspartate/D-glutamate deacylase